jgi:hypothetical protein
MVTAEIALNALIVWHALRWPRHAVRDGLFLGNPSIPIHG